MTRPKRSNAPKGARGHAPKKMVAQGRGGTTRDSTRPVREPTSRDPDSGERRTTEGRSPERRSSSDSRSSDSRPRSGSSSGGARRYGSASAGEGSSRGGAKSGTRSGAAKAGSRAGSKGSEGRPSGSKPSGGRSAEGRSAEGRSTESRSSGGKPSGSRSGSASGASSATGRAMPPRVYKKKALPELKRVQLDAPDPDTAFRDRDGQRLTFPDSNLRRMAAHILTEKNKAWRYRPFSFPLFTDRGSEQSFNFDFYIYDAEDSVIRLILVVPYESREVWDRVGRFKRQYPMYTYELWTPEKLAQLSGPRGRLGF